MSSFGLDYGMIQIREAILSDSSFIVDAQIAMAKETENLTLDPETVHAGVQAVFRDRTKGCFFVALVDHEVAACLLTVPEWSEWRNGTVLWVHSVYVCVEMRRKGLFRKMYHHLKAKVEEDPTLRGLRLYVEKKNDVAKDTYSALGMTNEHYELFEWMKN